MKNLIFAVLLAILAWSPAAATDLDAKLIWKAKQICNDFGYQKANENYAECVRNEYNQLLRDDRGDPYDRQSEAWLTRDRTHDGYSRRSRHHTDLIRQARHYCQDYPRYLSGKCVADELHLLLNEQREDPYDRNSAAWLTHEENRWDPPDSVYSHEDYLEDPVR